MEKGDQSHVTIFVLSNYGSPSKKYISLFYILQGDIFAINNR